MDDRLGDPAFPVEKEGGAGERRGRQRQGGVIVPAEALGLVDRQQQCADRQRQQDRAGGVERLAPAGVRQGRPALAKQQRGKRDRGAEPEHRRPPPEMDEDASQQRPDGRAQREHHRKGAESAASVLFGKQTGDEGRRDADNEPGADPLQEAKKEQPGIARRRGAQQKSRAAPQQADAEHPPVAEDVAGAAASQHQARIGQHIGDDHPLDHRDRQAEARGDVGKGDIDRGVERDDRGAKADQHQGQQAAFHHAGSPPRGRCFPAGGGARRRGLILAAPGAVSRRSRVAFRRRGAGGGSWRCGGAR
jgi:hypothetical protein